MSTHTQAFFVVSSGRSSTDARGRTGTEMLELDRIRRFGGRSSMAVLRRQRGSEAVRLASPAAVKRSLRDTEVVRPGGSRPCSSSRAIRRASVPAAAGEI